MSSDNSGSSAPSERKQANGRLSLWPLTVEEAAEAVLQVPPPPKKAKTPKAGQPSKNGTKPQPDSE
jgi:hypothetical protein